MRDLDHQDQCSKEPRHPVSEENANLARNNLHRLPKHAMNQQRKTFGGYKAQTKRPI